MYETGDWKMYTMMQVCKEANMTYQTLKYYCNKGLVPNVKRDKNNRRIFDERDLKWSKNLICLKKCDMNIQEMKEYLDLCMQGEMCIRDSHRRTDSCGQLRSSRRTFQISPLLPQGHSCQWSHGR